MAGLVLAAAFVLSLTGAGQARAADCATAQECYNAATWQRAVADDYSNKAAWFREMSRQNFVSAKEWGDKATFAFHAGDATAATWYKAIADDYSSKSVANAKAADDYANRAKFIYAAAEGNVTRGNWLGSCLPAGDCSMFTRPPGITDAEWFQSVAELSGGSEAEPSSPVTTCPAGVYCDAIQGHGPCTKIDNVRPKKFLGFTVFKIHATAHWCYKNGQITKLYSSDAHCDVTAYGVIRGFTCDNPDGKGRRECYGGNPEHCAVMWSFDIHKDTWTPTTGQITVARYHWCATNQISGSGAWKKTGHCDNVEPWSKA
jgi:hypothetical protein